MLEARLVKHMAAVAAYRERLASLQGSWDTLALLSHLNSSGAQMGQTRQAFEGLAVELLNNLGTEAFKKAALALRAKAQIAIDIMVRNLYERTADIGFLCADDDLKRFVAERQALCKPGAVHPDMAIQKLNGAMHRRLREYAEKYSVYHDVLVLDLQGQVLLQLDGDRRVERSADPLIAQTLATRGAYLETFRVTDLVPGGSPGLIYSYRICDGDRPTAVLCLCFKFANEVAAIFDKLRNSEDWTVLAYLDCEGRVIASSDTCQLPPGTAMTPALAERGSVVRFAGREYLAITRPARGYQGYAGPGWYGHAMLPLEHAFESQAGRAIQGIPSEVLHGLQRSESLFSQTLRDIPVQAHRIQRELNRSVWNGNISLAARTDSNTDFSKVLLREIGNAGVRTQETFERSIAELHETVISAIMEDAQQFAALAVDILDRNLYERANDCRWWALNGTLRQVLAGECVDIDAASRVLRHINSLYTVYHGLVVFDARRNIVAVSNPDHQAMLGQQLHEDWATQALNLRDSQSYCASPFERSGLYGNNHTLIFGAAIRDAAHQLLGGIGVVFDTLPQLDAMLQAALPRSETGEVAAGSIGVFIDADRRVLAATSHFKAGDTLEMPSAVFGKAVPGKARLIAVDGHYYAAGICKTSGYREYTSKGIAALIMIRLGPAVTSSNTPRVVQSSGAPYRGSQDEPAVDVATFYCRDQWLGILRDQIVESTDGSGLRSLPGRPPWHAGILVHRDEPITVVDVARLMGGDERGSGTEVIIVRRNDQRVGLLVDELADIPEVATHRMMAVNDVLLTQCSNLIGRAVKPLQPDGPILLVVDLDRIFEQLRPGDVHSSKNAA